MLLDPNVPVNEFSDEELINEFLNPSKYKRRNLYGVMARRATNNVIIKNMLFGIVVSDEARKETEMGFILHSWLPAILILKESSNSVKLELKQLLKEWTKEEKGNFLSYIKKEQEYYSFLCDI